MSDQEMLLLAAFAISLPQYELVDTIGDCGGVEKAGWNPLEDDGEALRLAMALLLDIEFNNGDTLVLNVGYGGDEVGVNTRRAIVHAAANIGLKMKAQS